MENSNLIQGLGIGSGIGSNVNAHDNHKDMDHVYGIVNNDIVSPGTSSSATLNSSTSSIRGRSKVWNEFSVTPDGRKVACRLCGDCLAYSNSHSTSSMLKHLKRKHNLDLYPSVTEDDGSNPSQTERFNRSPSSLAAASDKRNRPKSKKSIPKDAEEIDTSIQHGPLLFKDPCVRMKWTDHSDTFLRTFSSLYSDESYTDVTIVAEKLYFKAHRLILSSASEFFDETFKMTPVGQHPIIYLKDVKAMDLRILLDFIYKGEVSIPPSLIPGLVKIGRDLRVRGLSDFIWNEQLASSIFQPQQPQPNQIMQNETRNVRPVQQMQQGFQQPVAQQTSASTAVAQQYSTSTSTTPNPLSDISGATTNITNNKVFTPIRTVVRHSQPLTAPSGTSQPQNSSSNIANGATAPRTYSRIVNLRPTTPSPSNGLHGQIISGDIGAVCSSVASSFPSMKRIRILTSATAGLQSKQGSKTGQEGSNLQTINGNDSNAETVLMVTNEGETVLSTTQGGVTVLTPNTPMALPLGVALKEERFNGSNQIQSFQTSQVQSQPVTVLTSSPARNQDINEVVYSITELPGGDHEVLMAQDHEMVVCGDDPGGMVDRKPF